MIRAIPIAIVYVSLALTANLPGTLPIAGIVIPLTGIFTVWKVKCPKFEEFLYAFALPVLLIPLYINLGLTPFKGEEFYMYVVLCLFATLVHGFSNLWMWQDLDEPV